MFTQEAKGMTESDYIKEQVDIVEVASKYLQLKRSGKNFFASCPFHNEKTGSFSVNQQGQFYKCFGCGAGGDVYKLVMYLEGISFPGAVKKLKEEYGIDTKGKKFSRGNFRKNFEQEREKLPDEELHKVYHQLQEALTLFPKHLKHLVKDRRMSVEEIQVRGYRSCPEKPWTPFFKMEKRNYKGIPGFYSKTGKDSKEYWLLSNMGEGILIPFRNEYNQIIGWQIRLDEPPIETHYKTDYPDRFTIHETTDGIVKALWEGEIIGELNLGVGEPKHIKAKNGTILGEVGKKKGRKYFWLSSEGKKNGVGSGNPIPIHIAVPKKVRGVWPVGKLMQVRTAWITEGPFKADIAADKLNAIFVSVPGLSSWRLILKILARMNVKEIVLAFDMDIARKEELRDQIIELKKELEKQGQIRKCSLASWNEEENGKGIDDCLVNDYEPEVSVLYNH